MESFYEQIDPFLNGELTGEALTHFEEALRNDPELAKEVEFQRNLDHVMVTRFRFEKEEADLRQTLSEVGGRYFQPEPPTAKEGVFQKFQRLLGEWFSPRTALVWRLAPVWVVLLVAVPWYLLLDTSLYEEYRPTIQPPALVSLSGSKDLLDAANLAYQAGDFAKALPFFDQYLKQVDDDPYTRLYKGVCEMELNQFDAAIATFNQVAASPNHAGDAYWCLALTYLKMENKVAAKEALSKVPEESNRHAKALELQKELGN